MNGLCEKCKRKKCIYIYCEYHTLYTQWHWVSLLNLMRWFYRDIYWNNIENHFVCSFLVTLFLFLLFRLKFFLVLLSASTAIILNDSSVFFSTSSHYYYLLLLSFCFVCSLTRKQKNCSVIIGEDLIFSFDSFLLQFDVAVAIVGLFY